MLIDVLPDDVLLVIFDFCANRFEYQYLSTAPAGYVPKKALESWWRSLVHVCRRWRIVVFGSTRRLNLRLVCTEKTPARDTLDVWPDLPLYLEGPFLLHNAIPVLQRSDRVCRIRLPFLASQLEEVSAAMQVPFPELIFLYLLLRSNGGDIGTATVLRDSFLGGYAPRLRFLCLDGIPFPGLPKLPLSATHLAHLHLRKIPHSGYISPQAMVTILSTLTSLEELSLDFTSPRSRPDQASRLLPPRIRAVLPVLTLLEFKGVSEYLEDLVARIDAPRLSGSRVIFFNDIIFDSPQLAQFICRTPILKALEDAHVVFGDATAGVFMPLPSFKNLLVKISCKGLDWQTSSLAQVCTRCLPPITTLKDLFIYEYKSSQSEWEDHIENMMWLNILHPFTTVENLYLSKKIAPHIVAALQELVGGRATEVLPTLQNIFLEELKPPGPVQEGIGQFVAARQETSHQIAVNHWKMNGRYMWS